MTQAAEQGHGPHTEQHEGPTERSSQVRAVGGKAAGLTQVPLVAVQKPMPAAMLAGDDQDAGRLTAER